MNVVAAVLVVLAGLFYAADHNEIGELEIRCAGMAARFAIIQLFSWALSLAAPGHALSAFVRTGWL